MEPIPFLSLEHQHNQVKAACEQAILQVFRKNRFILGEEVASFEHEFAEYLSVPFCIGVGSGLDAIHMALRAADIKPGDEVIVPAHTYIATWLAISETGARIIPVEPDPHTFNIDISQIESCITAKTRAILPVHLYGQACNMTSIDEIARRHDLIIIEDNAQGHGAKWLEKLTGSYGSVNATSFYPTKNLGAIGDGGAVTTYNEDADAFVRRYRNYGFSSKNIGEDHGRNSRLDEVQAAVLRIKLKHLDRWNEERRHLAAQYLEQLKGIDNLILPLSDKEAHHVYHLFVIRTKYRNELKDHLLRQGIETAVHYPVPPHLQKTYSELNYKKGDFPLTEQIADTCLSLPLWPGMRADQIERISEAIHDFFTGHL